MYKVIWYPFKLSIAVDAFQVNVLVVFAFFLVILYDYLVLFALSLTKTNSFKGIIYTNTETTRN